MHERKDKWSVGQWMTSNPQTISPQMSVRAAFTEMRYQGYRHLPVVDQGQLVGMVTDRDLRRPEIDRNDPEGWHDFYNLDEDYEVRHVMTNRVDTVSPGDRLERALDLLVEKKYGALPVIDKDGKVIGILTSFDVLQAFRDALGQVGKKLRQ